MLVLCDDTITPFLYYFIVSLLDLGERDIGMKKLAKGWLMGTSHHGKIWLKAKVTGVSPTGMVLLSSKLREHLSMNAQSFFWGGNDSVGL